VGEQQALADRKIFHPAVAGEGAAPAAFGMPRAPALPPPAGRIVHVSAVDQLEDAVARLRSDTTVLVAPGTYRLRTELVIRGVHGVAIRGASGRPDDVVIRGSGMSTAGVNINLHVQDSRDVLIADVSLGDAFYHLLQLQGETGTDRIRVYNVRFFDSGQQFIKASVDFSQRDGVDDAIVEYSVFEYSDRGPQGGYTAGIDILRGANWVIRQNLFRNIAAPRGAPAAVLTWHGSRNITTDRNTFVNCARAVVYGLQPQPEYGHSNEAGVISNNMITFSRPSGADAAISAWDSPGTRIVHNTVVLNGGFPHAIEYRFPGSTNVEIANNLTDSDIAGRDGARATLGGNVHATPELFVSVQAGDLHLKQTAAAALARGVRSTNAGADWDGDPRPFEHADVGADQVNGVQ